MKLKPADPHWSKPRGVFQRNHALAWLRENKAKGEPGVVYFADDDNTYSSELFEVLRATRRVSVVPVGLVGGVMVERPQVAASGLVTGWAVGWGRSRPYATDMAGFAVALSHLLARPSALFPTECRRGHLESEFLKHLVTGLEELEPVAGDRVLVWHTRTELVNLKREEKFAQLTGHKSDHGLEV
jgi:galactosylgalactosylxylosylprotein 3-beta-glucuronosyltransferase 3